MNSEASDAQRGSETAPGEVAVAPLAGRVGYRLRRAQLAVFDEFIRVLSPLDLRPAQYGVLAVLKRTPGLKQSEVAETLGIQRANFVALFDGLERRGLARREPMPNDRRSYALHLTAAGDELIARASVIEARLETGFDDRLGPGGREQLLALLGRLVPHE